MQAKLEVNPEKIWSLNEMETTGGEPDVVLTSTREDKNPDEYIFMIVLRKVQKAAGVLVTIVQRRNRGKNLNPQTMPSI